jgi:hypothetical protein
VIFVLNKEREERREKMGRCNRPMPERSRRRRGKEERRETTGREKREDGKREERKREKRREEFTDKISCYFK